MAATEHIDTTPPARQQLGAGLLGSLVLAACALPGVMPAGVRAEEAPEQGVIAFKLSGYSEKQGSVGLDGGDGEEHDDGRVRASAVSSASGGAGGNGQRISVLTPSVYALVPINRRWAAEGSLTVDDVSGASPRYYTDMSGASQMKDRRTAGDVKLTHYRERQSVAFGLSRSSEQDYLSQAASVEARLASNDQNTTWNVGLGLTRDKINPYNLIVRNASRRTTEWQVGVTQAVTPRDLVQLTLTRSQARGYLNDPYKLHDDRPDQRNASIVQLRWNHWLGIGALKSGYRLYRDSYQVQAHTVDLALAVPLFATLTATPELRYHTQRAAAFYADPAADPALYPGPVGTPEHFSNDQRLASFGAITAGGKLAWQVTPRWSVDAKLSLYRQASSWHLGGKGSPGLDPLTALFWQLGLAHSF